MLGGIERMVLARRA